MNQTKLIAVVLLVAGVVFLYLGLNASDSPADQLTEAFTGQYTDRTMMYLIGGGISALIGAVMLFKK